MRTPSAARRLLTAAVTAVTAVTAAGLVLAVAAPAGAATPGTSAGTTAAAPPLVPGRVGDYVALGDSFTAGPLIPLQRLDPLGCARSTSNYPAVLAFLLRVTSFTDVSCSGAATADMYAPQSVPLGSNPAQLDAVHADTDLVSVSIGGNDFGVYGTLISTCTALYESDPQGAPCREKLRGTFAPEVAAIGGRVGRVVDAIHARAPHARVVVVGYERIAPSDHTCQDVLPLATGDYPFLDRIERSLDAALRDAARGHDATYVDSYAASVGHDACAGDQAWVNGKHLNLLAAAPYHPFFSGMVGVGLASYRTLTGTPAGTTKARDLRARLAAGRDATAAATDRVRTGTAGARARGHRTPQASAAERRAVRHALREARAELRRAGLEAGSGRVPGSTPGSTPGSITRDELRRAGIGAGSVPGASARDRELRRALGVARVCRFARA